MSLLPSRYRPENLRRLLSSPEILVGELHRLGNRANRYVHSNWYRPDGIDVMAADWDDLFILDGCRYDVYAEHTDLGGDLQRRTSPAGESLEYMQANFAGRRLHDTVYVTANPHVAELEPDVFHAVIDVLEDGWDPELRTVPPEAVAEATRDAHERFPDKRLVVHFMQPHFPFIGETGRRIDQGGIDVHLEERSDTNPVWTRLAYGLVDPDLVWQAYVENLRIVLEVVDDLRSNLDGRTVVTSDHGNLFGERLWPIPARGYGHPRGLYPPELVTVPWEVLPATERRQVHSDPPRERVALEDSVVERRLEDLGYTA